MALAVQVIHDMWDDCSLLFGLTPSFDIVSVNNRLRLLVHPSKVGAFLIGHWSLRLGRVADPISTGWDYLRYA